MTPALRRAHRRIWYALAVLLPLGWLAAVLAIPQDVRQEPVRRPHLAALPLLLSSKESGPFLINLRGDSARVQKQLEILVKSPQTNPSTLVYWSGPGAQSSLLGALQTRGLYRFALDSLAARESGGTLRLEDPIERRTLRTVRFYSDE